MSLRISRLVAISHKSSQTTPKLLKLPKLPKLSGVRFQPNHHALVLVLVLTLSLQMYTALDKAVNVLY